MDLEQIVHMLVVHRLLRKGYDPANVKISLIAECATKIMAELSADEIMKEWKRSLQ